MVVLHLFKMRGGHKRGLVTQIIKVCFNEDVGEAQRCRFNLYLITNATFSQKHTNTITLKLMRTLFALCSVKIKALSEICLSA